MNIKTNIHSLICTILTLSIGSVWMSMLYSCTENSIFSDEEAQDISYINIGGIDTDELTASYDITTRGTEEGSNSVVGDPDGAEQQSWLIQPLKKGLDISYGLYKDNEKSCERVAILKLEGGTINDDIYNTSSEGLAEYSFKYRDDVDGTETEELARWYDNGLHYFEGVHVPNRIRYDGSTQNSEAVWGPGGKSPDITSDQHDGTNLGTDDELGNYTLLSHYLGMPASTRISATISRIKLPFQHRLARVLVYVLIDPTLGKNTKIKGYKSSAEEQAANIEDATTSEIRLCNVEVLEAVKDDYDATKKIHTLTPIWKTQRKVIPHFVGEDGTYNSEGREVNADFIMYTNVDKEENIFGTSSKWQSAHNSYTTAYNNAKAAHPDATESELAEYAATASHYRQTNYGKAPLYDIIVRPTYTRTDNIMYDENLTALGMTPYQLVQHKNSIDFELALNTNLQYQKHFEFDLDANYQTVVYLRISREEVNYNTSGAEQWIAKTYQDSWYGLDNENGNTLSLAGNSWQRAYYNYKINYGEKDITDGHYYQEDAEGMGQYVGQDNWKQLLAEAYAGGAHHGDYFILNSDITIDASELPENFVFTGHLDGRDHIIRYTGGGSDIYEEVENIYPATGLYAKKPGESSYSPYNHPEALYICEEIAQAKTRGLDEIERGDGRMTKVTPTLSEVMSNEVIYYTYDSTTKKYTLFNPRSWTFATKRIGAGSLFCGINGNYTTNQESSSPARDANGKVIWEANVHKETNKYTVWVPTLGWRSEIINVKVKGGTLLPNGYMFDNSGNVRNCYDVDASGNRVKAYTNTPDLPEYK